MKYRICIWILVILGSLCLVQAQDAEPQYRLHVPSADKYLKALPDIFEQLKNEAPTDKNKVKPDYVGMLDISWNEIQAKYPDLDNVPYETLVNAAPYFFANTFNSYSTHHWETATIWAALQENKSLLSTQSQFQIHNYSFDVNKIDFNGDGVDEVVLTITSDGDTYKDYWVLEVDLSSPFGYRRVKTPDLWFSDMCNFRELCGGAAQVLELRDLNADSLPEWVIAEGSYCGYGECGGNLLVLGWRNNEIVEIAQTKDFWDLGWTGESGGGTSPLLPPDGSWIFENVDTDAALELVQHIPFTDNRGCKIVDNRIFDWSPETQMYIRSKVNRTYADDTACALRVGHETMETGDYEGAITAYERASVLFDKQKNLDDYDQEAKQYAQIRLMLSYALANHSKDALRIRVSLEKQSSQSDIMQSLLGAVKVYHNQSDQIKLCQAVNAAVGQYMQSNTDYNFSIFATKDDVSGRGMYGGGDFNADSSGCDVGILLQHAATEMVLNSGITPDKGLSDKGWSVVTSFKADLNNDGVTDWLIWTEETSYTIAFMSTNQGYKPSLVFVSKPDTKTQLSVQTLNNHENPLLVELSYDTEEGYDFCGNKPPVGRLHISQWNNGDLHYAGSSMLCERRTLNQLFRDPDVLQAWDSANNFSGKVVEATYRWNAIKKLFEVSSKEDFIPNIQDFNKFECYGLPYAYCGFEFDYDVKIEAALLKQVLDQPDKDMSPIFLTAVRYSRALALEALNRSDEALTEYVTIYQDAPESAWGKLAALHLECVANCS